MTKWIVLFHLFKYSSTISIQIIFYTCWSIHPFPSGFFLFRVAGDAGTNPSWLSGKRRGTPFAGCQSNAAYMLILNKYVFANSVVITQCKAPLLKVDLKLQVFVMYKNKSNINTNHIRSFSSWNVWYSIQQNLSEKKKTSQSPCCICVHILL